MSREGSALLLMAMVGANQAALPLSTSQSLMAAEGVRQLPVKMVRNITLVAYLLGMEWKCPVIWNHVPNISYITVNVTKGVAVASGSSWPRLSISRAVTSYT